MIRYSLSRTVISIVDSDRKENGRFDILGVVIAAPLSLNNKSKISRAAET